MMRGVKGWYLGVCTLLLVAGLGFSVPNQLNSGVYYFTEMVDLTPIEGLEHYWQRNNVSAVAPKDIRIDIDLSQAKKVVYSYVELGNAKQRFDYVATINGKGDWESLYVDLDSNGAITPDEMVLLHIQNQDQGHKFRMNANPIRVLVNYKNTAGNAIHKFLSFDVFLQHHIGSGQVILMHRTRSWFLGEARFIDRKLGEVPVKIALVDLNNDGVFSDFNQDGLFIDANYNGVFEKREKAKITALMDVRDKEKGRVQYRNYVFSWPYCLAVVPVKEWIDSANYEPKDDGEPQKKTDLPPVKDGLNVVDINSIVKDNL